MKDIKYLVNSDPTAYSVGATALGQSPYRATGAESQYSRPSISPGIGGSLELTELESDEVSKKGKGLVALVLYAIIGLFLLFAAISLFSSILS